MESAETGVGMAFDNEVTKIPGQCAATTIAVNGGINWRNLRYAIESSDVRMRSEISVGQAEQ
jgi:hypothetical protein